MVSVPLHFIKLVWKQGTVTNIRALDPATPESHQMLYLTAFSTAPSLFWVLLFCVELLPPVTDLVPMHPVPLCARLSCAGVQSLTDCSRNPTAWYCPITQMMNSCTPNCLEGECAEMVLRLRLKGFKLNRTEKFLPPTWNGYRDRWLSAVSGFKIGQMGGPLLSSEWYFLLVFLTVWR